jgi:hypothetical protein
MLIRGAQRRNVMVSFLCQVSKGDAGGKALDAVIAALAANSLAEPLPTLIN